MLRKLIGINNFTERTTNFMDGETEIKIHEKVYALETEEGTMTLREKYVVGKDCFNTVVTEENPYKLDFNFVENETDWEEYIRLEK